MSLFNPISLFVSLSRGTAACVQDDHAKIRCIQNRRLQFLLCVSMCFCLDASFFNASVSLYSNVALYCVMFISFNADVCTLGISRICVLAIIAHLPVFDKSGDNYGV